MEETWADMDKEPDSTNDNSGSTPTPKEIAARNASVIKTMKRNVQIFRSMHDNKIVQKCSMAMYLKVFIFSIYLSFYLIIYLFFI